MNILLIDLSGLLHAIWHVSGADSLGNPDIASQRTVERVRALASGQPHVAVCCEGGRSFRRDLDPTYKAQRPAQDAALTHQMQLAIDTLKADGFPVWSAPGFEADDVLASAVAWFDAHAPFAEGGSVRVPHAVTIVSADKDLEQLISPTVTILKPTNGDRWDATTVLAKRGVEPNQIVDYLALCGDTSDNIKGCDNVGPKKAAALLTKYGTLEDVYAALQKNGTSFTPAGATALREFEPRMALVRSLIRLRTDADVPFADVFKERVAADVATFSMEDELTEGIKQDIEDAMPTRSEIVQTVFPIDPMEQMARDARPVVVPTVVDAPRPSQALTTRPATVVMDFKLEDGPATYDQAKLMAADLFAAKLFTGYGSPAAVLSTILIGRELGLSVGASLRGFHIVENKHTMAADLIRARAEASPDCEYFYCKARTNDAATFVTKHRKHPEPIELTYTMAEAEQSGTVKPGSGYKKNPADMLVARASSKLARLVYPAAVHGFYAPDEMEHN